MTSHMLATALGVLFARLAGVLIGLGLCRSGPLLGVTVAHVIASIVHFTLMPYRWASDRMYRQLTQSDAWRRVRVVTITVRRRLLFTDWAEAQRAGSSRPVSTVGASGSLPPYPNAIPRIVSHDSIRRAARKVVAHVVCGRGREACCGSWFGALNTSGFDRIEVTKPGIDGRAEEVGVARQVTGGRCPGRRAGSRTKW